jgi:HK97 family phage major capsid protein
MPSVAADDKVPVVLGDIGMAAMLGDRRRTSIAFSDSAGEAFQNDEIWAKGTERVDIVVHDVGNADGTAANRVPGPVVGLATAAA